MKKFFFFAALAAIGLASCSSDETIASQATSESNEISFRPLVNGLTRAADITSAGDLKSFNVYAFKTGETTPAYISNVEFVGPGTYNSTNKYYWPDYNLDFYAWSANSAANGNRNTNVTATDYHTFNVTADATAANQADFIYAVKTDVANPSGAVTALNFAHQESRIILKVKNTAGNLSFAITGWKIVYPDNTGTVTFTGTTPAWSANTTQSVSNVFTSAFSSTPIAANAEAAQIGASQIMIPQGITNLSGYNSGSEIASPYIAVQYTATNTATSPASEFQAQTWGCWLIPTVTWTAGNQYTYTIDIADGGYYETDQNGDGALDPIFEDKAIIQFSDVSVSTWTNGTVTPDPITM